MTFGGHFFATPLPSLLPLANVQLAPHSYDRDFLLQFMQVCKEKPDNLPDLDVLGLQPSEHYPMTRTASGRRPNSVNMGPPSRSASIGLGIGFSGKPGTGGNFSMGNFATDRETVAGGKTSRSGTCSMLLYTICRTPSCALGVPFFASQSLIISSNGEPAVECSQPSRASASQCGALT